MPSLKLEPFLDEINVVWRLRSKTAVGAAKPFGRPPILCSAEVALAAYIGGAGGGVKWG